MGGKAKGKHCLDKFYHLAKEHDYHSQAVWKLVQLNSKVTFIHSSHAVLDLCAAPGGWMQTAVERDPVGSLVIGVDLDPIRLICGAIAIWEDITTPKCRATVKRLMSEHDVKAFDLVLHDGSPNIGGALNHHILREALDERHTKNLGRIIKDEEWSRPNEKHNS
ncbi:putative 27S pre-rRNA (guanosine(2922)-2'-O)-methyltransferase [Helianthus debilis subsp. tardiflorus]